MCSLLALCSPLADAKGVAATASMAVSGGRDRKWHLPTKLWMFELSPLVVCGSCLRASGLLRNFWQYHQENTPSRLLLLVCRPPTQTYTGN